MQRCQFGVAYNRLLRCTSIKGDILQLPKGKFSDRATVPASAELAVLVKRIIRAGYHPEQGARPLRRALTRLLEDSLAESILSGRVKSGESVRVDLDEHGQIAIEKVEPQTVITSIVLKTNQGDSSFVALNPPIEGVVLRLLVMF